MLSGTNNNKWLYFLLIFIAILQISSETHTNDYVYCVNIVIIYTALLYIY